MSPELLAMMMGGQGGGLGAGLGGILQGIFGNSGKPYEQAGKAYLPFYNKAQGYQNPFYNAGTGAIPQYQDWLKKMADPSGFINNLMGGYKESPFARYQQEQSVRAGTNAASASGLTGSTPFAQQLQQNASNISGQDMNQWLQNVLGVNTQYGAGLGGLMQGGQHAGDILSQLASNAGEYMGGVGYGKEAGQQQDRNSLWGGITKIFGG